MRVIAGSHKGRRLLGPRQPGLRPTPDRVKEALFSILGDQILEARMLDLYAGTGAIGIEALSRGATHATFVDNNPSSLEVLHGNLARCGLVESSTVYTSDSEAFLEQRSDPLPFDIIFADPPYKATDAIRLLSLLDGDAIVTADASVILEHSKKALLPPEVGNWSRVREYRYGDTSLSLYTRALVRMTST